MSLTERTSVSLALSRHLMIEYYDCDKSILNDAAELESIFLEAVKRSNATVIDYSFRTFEPQGVSGFVVISESHFSIHTWPEFGYAAVDIFTCGDTVNCEAAINHIHTAFQSAAPIISGDTRRGIVTNEGLNRVVPTILGEQHQFSLSWETSFKESRAKSLQVTLDLKNCCPKTLRSPTELKRFVLHLCDQIGLQPSGECEVTRIDDPKQVGFNVLQRMGASSISAQTLHNTNACYIDILMGHYTEPRVLAEFTLNALQGSDYTLQLALRQ